ncbi:hypothetical protein [Qipengyuania sp.]|uniref:hypothetical protein n=1 Tax=Qipengyuania sp. TaxID=2004515 RepID=UPI0035C85E3F
MAEDVDPSLGHKDQFWLDDAGSLYKLIGVKEFDIPTGGQREQVEDTDLDHDWRRTYLSAFYEDTDFEVLLNARFLSDTDTLLTEARNAADVRPFKAVIAIDGTPTAQVEGTAKCTGYSYSRVTPGGLKEATATFRVATVNDIAAYVAAGA